VAQRSRQRKPGGAILAHHWSITGPSLVHHRPITGPPPAHHRSITGPSPAHHRTITGLSPITNEERRARGLTTEIPREDVEGVDREGTESFPTGGNHHTLTSKEEPKKVKSHNQELKV
jgi:hypothetical protein